MKWYSPSTKLPDELIHRLVQLDDLADRLVAGGDHHALGAVEHLERVLAPHRAERMGDDVLVVQVLQAVEDARVRSLSIFLDVQDGAEVVGTVGGVDDEVTGLGRKHVPAHWQVVLDRCRQHRHRLVDAIDQVAEQL